MLILFIPGRIGLDPGTGQPVDIDFGGKLAGRIGDYSVGVLAVQQGDRPGLDGQNVVIARATRNILNESRIGFIVTDGDPNSEIDNSVVGTDFLIEIPVFQRVTPYLVRLPIKKLILKGVMVMISPITPVLIFQPRIQDSVMGLPIFMSVKTITQP